MRTKNLIAAVVWSALFAGAASPFDYLAIQNAITSRHFSEASLALEARIKSAPADGYAHLLMGIVQSEMKNPGLAEVQFREAVRLRPQDPAPHTNLGNLLASLGRLGEAKQQFEAALRLNPRDATTLSNLGALEMSLKEYEPAKKCFESADRSAPGDVRALLGLFQAELKLGLTAPSHQTANRLLGLPGADEQAIQIVGALQGESRDYRGAISTFETGLSRFPQSTGLLFNLGLAQQKAGDAGKAMITFEGLRSRQDTAEVEDVLGGVYEQAGKPLEAVKSFQKAAEMEPSNESYRFDYASELLAHLNFEAARLVAEPAVHDFPGSMRMQAALAVALYGLERFEVAQARFVDLAHRFPDEDLPAQYVELCAEASGGSLAMAKELLEAHHKRHPDGFMAPYLLGRIAVKDSDTDTALRLLERSIQLRPDYAPSRLEYGIALAQTGRTQDAVTQYLAALKLDPHNTEGWYRLTLAYRKLGKPELAGDAEKQFHGAEAISGKPDLVKTFLYSTAQ